MSIDFIAFSKHLKSCRVERLAQLSLFAANVIALSKEFMQPF